MLLAGAHAGRKNKAHLLDAREVAVTKKDTFRNELLRVFEFKQRQDEVLSRPEGIDNFHLVLFAPRILQVSRLGKQFVGDVLGADKVWL